MRLSVSFFRLAGRPGPAGLIEELQSDRIAARARLSIATVEARRCRLLVAKMERHVHSSQAFAPLDCASYLVLVAPHGPDDMPDWTRSAPFASRAIRLINYKANTWHHPLTPLERTARFAVLTFVEGTDADEQFVDLPQPLLVEG